MAVLPADDSVESSHPIKRPLECRLRLRFDDVSHSGTAKFLHATDASKDLAEQTQNVIRLLYSSDKSQPGTRSVTFVLKDFEGVAYTTGTDLDNDHKEICFSLSYINQIGDHVRHEILGVLCHELVHCFQWDAEGTCSGGLIEGIADWVRLNAGLAAKHWQREADGKWDAGYQHTGFFLDYLEKRFGEGTVGKINDHLRKGPYDEEKLFKSCCDDTVAKLWEDYRKTINGTSTAPMVVPTHPATAHSAKR